MIHRARLKAYAMRGLGLSCVRASQSLRCGYSKYHASFLYKAYPVLLAESNSKMKKIIVLSLLVVFSCQTKTNEVQSDKPDSTIQNPIEKIEAPQVAPIYITTFTSYKQKNGEMGVKESTSTLKDKYFEVDLKSMGDHKTHQAEKELEPLTSLETLHSVSIGITDAKGNQIPFKSSTEFLNFMSEHGYEMEDQSKSRYHISYTFKKK